ncbi:hypothetical protein Q7P37_006809 [Cladosporium fusiforme]
MPPKRRSAARTASIRSKKSQQGKDLDSKKEFLFDEAINHSDVQPETDEPTTADKAIEQQAAVEVHALDDAASTRAEVDLTGESKIEDVLGGRAQPSDVGAVGGLTGSGWVGEEEAHARKITETQIKKFWREKENARLVPRVHQQDLTVHEKVLREWDVSGQYGPCIGIARLKRWKRANVLGLKPPIEVLAVLLREMDGSDGGAKVQRAYVDSLMSSRFVET